MNIRKILYALTKTGSLFHYRKHFCAVPNLSWGLLEWEADLAVVTTSGWLYEVEIKTTATDWHKDREKWKWDVMDKPGVLSPRRFYYAAPLELAKRWEEFKIPDYAGVIGIATDARGRVDTEIVRHGKNREQARRLTDDERIKVARLASMRFWGENHKRVQKEEWDARERFNKMKTESKEIKGGVKDFATSGEEVGGAEII